MKKCFKCGKTKPTLDFYKHPKTADGFLNKCKECTKSDAKSDYDTKSKSELFIEKEKKRGREKYRRLYTGTGKANIKASLNWIRKYPEKRKASLVAAKIKCEGYEKHHWSYLEEHHLDIIKLTTREHGKAHRFLIYDQERMMYRRYDNNELLDTKERHEKFIRHQIKNQED